MQKDRPSRWKDKCRIEHAIQDPPAQEKSVCPSATHGTAGGNTGLAMGLISSNAFRDPKKILRQLEHFFQAIHLLTRHSFVNWRIQADWI